jgi:hypothetical protein
MRDPDFASCMEKVWDLLRYDVDAAMRQNDPARIVSQSK